MYQGKSSCTPRKEQESSRCCSEKGADVVSPAKLAPARKPGAQGKGLVKRELVRCSGETKFCDTGICGGSSQMCQGNPGFFNDKKTKGICLGALGCKLVSLIRSSQCVDQINPILLQAFKHNQRTFEMSVWYVFLDQVSLTILCLIACCVRSRSRITVDREGSYQCRFLRGLGSNGRRLEKA